jgi:hypothetical protein
MCTKKNSQVSTINTNVGSILHARQDQEVFQSVQRNHYSTSLPYTHQIPPNLVQVSCLNPHVPFPDTCKLPLITTILLR